jgi:GT2 family glycosyltransferase
MSHPFLEKIGDAVNTFVLPFVFTDKVKEAVEAIWKAHSPQEHRLILIDNSGEDFEDKEWLQQNSHFYINCYRNIGPAVAYNFGIAMARTRYVTVTSDDARIVDPIWFKEAIGLIEEDKPLIISANSVHEKDILSEEWYGRYHQAPYVYLDGKFGRKNKGFGLACAIGKKNYWIQAGPFDEAKYIYYIDGTFADQAEKNGVDCFYSGVIFHYGDASHKGRLVEENKFHQTIVRDGVINL